MQRLPVLLLTVFFFGVSASSSFSGPRSGLKLSNYVFKKISGGEGDKMAVGRGRCLAVYAKSRPVVMVFSKVTSRQLADLAVAIEEKMDQSKQDSFVTIINLFGDYAKEHPIATAREMKVKRPVVVAPKGNGHSRVLKKYFIPYDDRITVIIATGKRQVRWSESYTPKELDDGTIAEIGDRIDQLILGELPKQTSDSVKK